MNTVPVVNFKYGCIYLPNSKLNALPLSLRNSVLHILASFISCNNVTSSRNFFEKIDKHLPLSKKVGSSNIIFFPVRDQLCIAKPCPSESKHSLKVEINKPFLWDKRWLITFSLLPEFRQKRPESRAVTVTGLRDSEYKYGRQRGSRKIRTVSLPHEPLRESLPVVRDAATNEIMLIPHLEVMDRSYGLSCSKRFHPSIPLDTVLKTTAHVHY